MTTDLMVIDNDFMPALSVPQAVQRFNTLVQFVQDVMREGVDYGKVPGTDKNTLMKAGAEKLTTLFGLTVRFQVVECIQDWAGDLHGGEPFFYYWYRCQLWRGELMIAEADGSCNSRESKYRWRWVNAADVPHGLNTTSLTRRGGSISEFTFAVDKAETGGKYGKPLEYWQAFQTAIENGSARAIKKKIKSGELRDAWEIDSTVYRIPNDDIAGLVNTIQKMAQKRALVAAALIGCNASEFFTQDVEDLPLAGDGASYVPAQPLPPTPPVNVVTGEIIDQPAVTGPPATPKQRNYIAALQDNMGWHSEALIAFAAQHGVDDLVMITSTQASTLIEAMKQESERPTPAATQNGERPLVTRLREVVTEARSLKIAIPNLPKPKEMTDEALMDAIDGLERQIRAKQPGDLFPEPAGHVSDDADLPL